MTTRCRSEVVSYEDFWGSQGGCPRVAAIQALPDEEYIVAKERVYFMLRQVWLWLAEIVGGVSVFFIILYRATESEMIFCIVAYICLTVACVLLVARERKKIGFFLRRINGLEAEGNIQRHSAASKKQTDLKAE